MTSETGYNGWKNYETWNIALWLDNEQGTYNLMNTNAYEAVQQVLDEDDSPYEHEQNRDQLIREASYKLSKVISDYIEENNPISTDTSCYADLLNAAIEEADFVEIAEKYINENVEEATNDWDFNSVDEEE